MKNSSFMKNSSLEGSWQEELVSVRRVTKVTKGGRRFSFSAIVVVGNGAGSVGYGMGKADSVANAIMKGTNTAKKNIKVLKIVGTTIPHDLVCKYGSVRIFMKPASLGTGLRAGGAVRKFLKVAGVQDVLSKIKNGGSSCNVVRAIFDSMDKLRTPLEISKQRGVSLDKVFKG